MKIFLKKIVFILASVLVVGSGCASQTAVQSPVVVAPTPAPAQIIVPTPTPSSTTGGLYDLANYTSPALGISFSYQKNFFTLAEHDGTVLLISPFYVSDNPSGLPNHEIKHTVGLVITKSSKLMADAINDESPFWVKNYNAVKLNSVKKDPLKMDSDQDGELFTVGGHEAYSFVEGLEGVNTKMVYVLAGENQTLVIRFSYITDFLKDGMKPDWLPEAEQHKLLKTILDSIDFNS